MFFHFLSFSQCVVCMFGHKTIYKVINLKVHSNGRYFQELPVLCDITKCKPRLLKFEWLAGGENTWLSSARFKIETRCGSFNITVFLKETACLQKSLDVIF